MKPALARRVSGANARFPGINEVVMSLNLDYFILFEPRRLYPNLIHTLFVLFAFIVEDFEC